MSDKSISSVPKAEDLACRPFWQWISFFSCLAVSLYGLNTLYYLVLPNVLDNPWWTSVLVCAICFMATGPSPLVFPIVWFLIPGLPEGAFVDFMALFPSDWFVVVILPAIILSFVFWVNGFVLLAIDLSGIAHWCKIQKNRPNVWDSNNEQPDDRNHWSFSQIIEVFVNTQFNMSFVPLLFMLTAFKLDILNMDAKNLPCHFEMAYHFLMFTFTDEVLFYYGHRALHHPSVYGSIHKKHHEFKSPVGLAAIYCHPLEMLLSNALPLAGGIFLVHSPHVYTFLVWVVMVVLGTQTHHCGYDWPWMGHDHQPNFHDVHHEKFNCNYGLSGLFDWFHKTDENYYKIEQELNRLKKKGE